MIKQNHSSSVLQSAREVWTTGCSSFLLRSTSVYIIHVNIIDNCVHCEIKGVLFLINWMRNSHKNLHKMRDSARWCFIFSDHWVEEAGLLDTVLISSPWKWFHRNKLRSLASLFFLIIIPNGINHLYNQTVSVKYKNSGGLHDWLISLFTVHYSITHRDIYAF